MTRTWSEELQPGDIFARLGGDEFLVLLVGSSDEEATRFFERLLFISPAQWSAGVDQAHERRGPERLPGESRQHPL